MRRYRYPVSGSFWSLVAGRCAAVLIGSCWLWGPVPVSAQNLAQTGKVGAARELREFAEPWKMAQRVLVLFNPDFAGSRELAVYYAQRRGIPAEQVVGLPCPVEETIDRATFHRTIRGPLRELFYQRGWWKGEDGAGESLRIRVICPVRGIPLRVKGIDGEPTGAIMRISAASVDSELALLGLEEPAPAGPVPNPYFRKECPFPDLGENRTMLVTRLDGPSVEVVRGMIDAAIEAERDGLWGKAYIDFAADGRSGAELGDGWLRDAARSLWSAGIPVVEEPHASRFPFAYPMRDAIFYFGWYIGHADGPFADPGFRMRPGAVACHMHSFSAETVRDASRRWAGPLVAHGAAVALGNVDEPFLQLMSHSDIFVDRLLRGYSVAEAAWMATPVLSWMSTVLGDPLYRPFRRARSDERLTGRVTGADEDTGYRAIEAAFRESGDAVSLKRRLLKAAESSAVSGDGVVTEALGLFLLARGDAEEAEACFRRAGELFQAVADRSLMELHRIDISRRAGRRDEAEGQLRELATSIAGTPEARAVEALLLQLDPPGPELSPPSRQIPSLSFGKKER